MLIIFTTLLGAIVGSFLNVVIYRWPLMLGAEENVEINTKNFNLAFPCSHCPECKHKLKIWHNIPLISYLLLRGKCGFCKTSISIQYLIVELSSVLLSLLMAITFEYTLGNYWGLLGALLFSWILLCITFIDAKYLFIPDRLNYLLLWIGLLYSAFAIYPFITPEKAIIGASLGYMILWTIAGLFKLLTKKEGMGHGDFKLLAALGAWIGPEMLIMLILIASTTGLLYGIFYAIKHRKKSIKNTPIPFGPFLAFAGIITFLLSQQNFFYEICSYL